MRRVWASFFLVIKIDLLNDKPFGRFQVLTVLENGKTLKLIVLENIYMNTIGGRNFCEVHLITQSQTETSTYIGMKLERL